MIVIFDWIKSIGKRYSSKARAWRGKLFLHLLKPTLQDKILDLGSGNGSHFFQFIKPGRNVYISDINPHLLLLGKKLYGYKTVLLDAGTKLPFKDRHFDIVFCNSLIEHVTGDKKKILYMDNKKFRKYAFEYQKQLANEIRRISKSYFVQTPYRYFPLESHTWLPLPFIFFPRGMQIRIIKLFNHFWPKKTYPDWHLLTIQQMKDLFPDSEIILEKSFGFVKSIIAIKK